MRTLLFSLVLLFGSQMSFAFQAKEQMQKPYFQQEVNTVIQVSLDDKAHTLTGKIDIEYINKSPNDLNEIYIHLWANAYKDRTTAFANQQLKAKKRKFHYAEDEDRGNFSGINFTIDGQSVPYSNYEGNQDVVVIRLPKTLNPGGSIQISTPLNLKIPASFSRLGHVGESYQMTQWFPKPAVYDRDGWHPMPYLNMGEFYSEFGSYDVSITLPENYVVCATGTLQNDNEIQFLNEKIQETKERAQDTIRDLSFPESSDRMKTIRYKADNVHDFGWFADKRFYVEKGNVTLSNGKQVDTWVFYTDTEKSMWQDALGYVDRSVKFYSDYVGNYPYPHATAVQSALSAGGGMEYPMITVIGAMGDPHALDGVITHEVGHNWFYGILGFNERDHPWLDEGINSYYDHRYDQMYYDEPMGMGLPPQFTNGMEQSGMSFALAAQTKRGHDQAPSLHSAEFENTNYFFSCYEKPALAFEFLEEYLGADRFDPIMKSLYKEWEFKHPSPKDVIDHFNKQSGEDLSWFFDGFIYSTDEVNYKLSSIKMDNEHYKLTVRNKGDINAPFPVTAYKAGKAVETKWFDAPIKTKTYNFPLGDYDYFVVDSSYTMLDIDMDNNYKKTKGISMPKIGFGTGFDIKDRKQIFLLPALGFNKHDGFMLGLNVHNMSLPLPRWKGSITSMYGFGSNRVVGTARLQYDQAVKKGSLQRVTYKLLSKQFSLAPRNENSDPSDFGTIVPSVNLHFVHGEGSLWTSDLSWTNTFARYTPSGITEGADDAFYSKLMYTIDKGTILNPFTASVGIEYMDYTTIFQGDVNAVKLDAVLKQSYEFMRNRKISVRAYGAFFPMPAFGNGEGATTNNETRAGSNNNINLIYNSFADHSYEDYFFGRNVQSGFYGNQVIVKDGGLKIGNNPDSESLGQSDLAAYSINIVSDLPIKKIPSFVKLYADYGSYLINRQSSSERQWESIVSAGVMLNFFDAVNIYVPVVTATNDPVRNWVMRGGPFINRVTFTLDLHKMDPIKLYNNYRI